MTEQSVALINLATRYIEEAFPAAICSFVNGSVGRGEADEFSDVDITVCINTSEPEQSDKNLIYEGRIIQLHIDRLPRVEEVHESPWDYRFLTESVPIFDPKEHFLHLKNKASEFFQSKVGRERLIHQGKQVVSERKQWALESTRKNHMYSATIAGDAAYVDAAFLLMFLETGSCSTNQLIPFLQKNDIYFTEYQEIMKLYLDPSKINESVRIVERYREYLRRKKGDSFLLSPLQDILVGGKVRRLNLQKQYINLLWQLRGEAFWLYLMDSPNQSFDEYFPLLPLPLRNALVELGFTPLKRSDIERLIMLSERLI